MKEDGVVGCPGNCHNSPECIGIWSRWVVLFHSFTAAKDITCANEKEERKKYGLVTRLKAVSRSIVTEKEADCGSQTDPLTRAVIQGGDPAVNDGGRCICLFRAFASGAEVVSQSLLGLVVGHIPMLSRILLLTN